MSTCSFKVDDKTPIAVVVDATSRRAIALNPLASADWSARNNDIIELPNLYLSAAKNDMNGQSNTQTILRECNSDCYAAKNAANYSVAGISGWYLPALGELYLARNNKSIINDGLRKLGHNALTATPYSSTELSANLVWLINFSDNLSDEYYTSSKNDEIPDAIYPFLKY